MVETWETTHKIILRLRAKYREDLLLEEFSTPSNSDHHNRADAIGISCHPAHSTTIAYYEIKATRADWLNELKHPSKSEWLASQCTKIWLLTPDENVAKLEEIPENWGWLYVKGRSFKIIKQAPELKPVFDLQFLIRIAQYSKREFNKLIAEEEWELRKKLEKEIEDNHSGDHWKTQAEHFENMYKELDKKSKALEEASGITLWNDIEELRGVGKIAKALFRIKQEQGELREETLGSMWNLKTIKAQLAIIEEAIKKIKRPEKDV